MNVGRGERELRGDNFELTPFVTTLESVKKPHIFSTELDELFRSPPAGPIDNIFYRNGQFFLLPGLFPGNAARETRRQRACGWWHSHDSSRLCRQPQLSGSNV